MLVTSSKMRSMLLSTATFMQDIIRDSKGTPDAEFYRTVAEGVITEARAILAEIPPDNSNLNVAPHLVTRWETLQGQYRSLVQQFNKDPETPETTRTAADVAYDALEAIGDSAKEALGLPGRILSGAAGDAGKAITDILKAFWPVLAIAGVLLVVVVVAKPKL